MYRLLLWLLLFLVPQTTLGGDDQYGSLQGITRMRLEFDNLGFCERRVLQRDFERNTKQILTGAGIEIVHDPLAPTLELDLRCWWTGQALFGLASVQLHQQIKASGSDWTGKGITWDMTEIWSYPTEGGPDDPESSRRLRGVLDTYIEFFLNDYRKANP